jgi:hypothetical protein
MIRFEMMNIRQKTNLYSALIIVFSLAITVALYVFFKIIFLFIIFVPPLIYHFLKKRSGGDNSLNGSPHV